MAYQANPYTAGLTAGTQYNEGEIITIVESALTHPARTGSMVNKGDPVLCDAGNNLIGVALKTAALNTDYIPVQRTGVWNLNVLPQNGSGNSNVVVGDILYIAASTAVVSKINTGTIFGYALAALAGGATASVIPVLLAKK